MEPGTPLLRTCLTMGRRLPSARHPLEKVGRGERKRECGGTSTLLVTSELLKNYPWEGQGPLSHLAGLSEGRPGKPGSGMCSLVEARAGWLQGLGQRLQLGAVLACLLLPSAGERPARLLLEQGSHRSWPGPPCGLKDRDHTLTHALTNSSARSHVCSTHGYILTLNGRFFLRP